MEQKHKIIAIVALVVVVLALTIGFAAFSKELDVTFSDSSVTPNGTLDIRFLATEGDKDKTEGVTTTVTPSTIGGATANAATIAADASTINNLGVVFTDKNQTVTYDFFIYNASDYDAYLRKVEMLNYASESTNKVCTPIGTTDADLVANACEDISLSIEIGDNVVMETKEDTFTAPEIGSKAQPIPVRVTIAYAGDSLLPNGDFKINFGSIKLTYSSLSVEGN